MTDHADDLGGADIEFFGIRRKVSNARLATLLISSADENVVVTGRRTVDLLSRADEEDGVDPRASHPEATDTD